MTKGMECDTRRLLSKVKYSIGEEVQGKPYLLQIVDMLNIASMTHLTRLLSS